MFFVIKKSTLWKTVVAIALIVCIIGAFASLSLASSPGIDREIVLDAGHGGADGGVCGINSKVTEAEINLTVSHILKNKLEENGFKVVMTRNDAYSADGVGDISAYSKKNDMAARKQIIERVEPLLVISIHCNKFPSKERRGAQVFFNKFSPEGKALAETLQSKLNALNGLNVGRTFDALAGDYYILNCSNHPSAIVECGFLSNPDDEALLLDEGYRAELSACITEGILAYLSA